MKKAMRIMGNVMIALIVILEELMGMISVVLFTTCDYDPKEMLFGIMVSTIIMMPGMIWIFIEVTKIKDRRNNSIEEAE